MNRQTGGALLTEFRFTTYENILLCYSTYLSVILWSNQRQKWCFHIAKWSLFTRKDLIVTWCSNNMHVFHFTSESTRSFGNNQRKVPTVANWSDHVGSRAEYLNGLKLVQRSQGSFKEHIPYYFTNCWTIGLNDLFLLY